MRKPAPRNQPGAGEAKGKNKHSNITPRSLPQIGPQPFRLLGNVVATIVDDLIAKRTVRAGPFIERAAA